MRNLSHVCLLLGALWWAQAQSALPVQSHTDSGTDVGENGVKQTAAAPVAVRPDQPVVTIKGLCAAGANKSSSDSYNAACETVITRAEFEKLSNALQPNMTASGKRQLAANYPRTLIMSREAERRGLDRQERFQELMAYERAQILSQELFRNIQEQAAQISDKDIDEYYKEHALSFQRATFERILIPLTKEDQGKKDIAGAHAKGNESGLEKENREAMVKEAEQLRQRAIAGEDFAELQKAAYDAGAVNAPIPPTKLTWRRGSLPASHLAVLDLKTGEISQVITDSSAHWIYKIDAKEIEPESEARKEIHAIVQKQRVQEMMSKLQEAATTQLNQEYFGASEVPKPPDASTKSEPDKD